jgi:hypothetical protein
MSEDKSEERISKSEGFSSVKPDGHFPEDAGAPPQPQTSNIEYQTKEMEVRHHGHIHSQKKWKEYLFQFFMLFLAVFCGFLAEYQLEHTIEHQREKQYMVTMLEDLKSDTALLSFNVKYWDNINNSIDSLTDAIQFPMSDADLVKAYKHLPNATDLYSFKFNDRTIAQLKNSGGFRLIRKKAVANKIILYDQFNNDAAAKIVQGHLFYFETMIQLNNKVFSQQIINKIAEKHLHHIPPASDNLWIDSMVKENKLPLSADSYSTLLFEFKNALLAYRLDSKNVSWAHMRLKEMMEELITITQKEYHLE